MKTCLSTLLQLLPCQSNNFQQILFLIIYISVDMTLLITDFHCGILQKSVMVVAEFATYTSLYVVEHATYRETYANLQQQPIYDILAEMYRL